MNYTNNVLCTSLFLELWRTWVFLFSISLLFELDLLILVKYLSNTKQIISLFQRFSEPKKNSVKILVNKETNTNNMKILLGIRFSTQWPGFFFLILNNFFYEISQIPPGGWRFLLCRLYMLWLYLVLICKLMIRWKWLIF